MELKAGKSRSGGKGREGAEGGRFPGQGRAKDRGGWVAGWKDTPVGSSGKQWNAGMCLKKRREATD